MDTEGLPLARYDAKNMVVEFTDKYGEKRIIHRPKGSPLRVKRTGNTPGLAMNRVVAELIGRRIRELRQARGWSLSMLCKRAGLAAADGQHKHRMYEIEVGARQEGLRFGTLYVIALALGVTAADLMPDPSEVARLAGCELSGDPLHVRVKP